MFQFENIIIIYKVLNKEDIIKLYGQQAESDISPDSNSNDN